MTIKPCPHCGGKAYLNKRYAYKTGNYLIFVKCDICGAQGRLYTSEEDPAEANWLTAECEDALDAWNMRTGEGVNTN